MRNLHKKGMSRLLSILLCLIMAFPQLTSMAYAVDEIPQGEEPVGQDELQDEEAAGPGTPQDEEQAEPEIPRDEEAAEPEIPQNEELAEPETPQDGEPDKPETPQDEEPALIEIPQDNGEAGEEAFLQQVELQLSYDISWYDEEKTDFTLSNEEQFRGFAALVNGSAETEEGGIGPVDFSGKTVRLENDITLSEEWVPIGNGGRPFSGTFDGGGNIISGMAVGAVSGYSGLFGYTSGGQIKELTVSGSVTGTAIYTGGIVGYASQKTEIINCTNLTNIKNSGTYTGGIVGWTSGTVEGCANGGTVVNSGKNYTGGIAGSSEGVLKNCFNSGRISGKNYIGGIAGMGRELTSCLSVGDIDGTGANIGDVTGGLAAYVGKVNNCYSKGLVTGKSGNNGTEADERDLEYGYVAWRLNTADGTEGNSGLWAQGGENPILGGKPVYRVKVVNYAFGEIGLSLKKNGEVVTGQAIYAEGNTLTLYTGSGFLALKPELKGEVTLEGFHFNPALSYEDGIYTAEIEKDTLLECGRGELPGESMYSSIGWYLDNENDDSYIINSENELWGLMALVNGLATDASGVQIPSVSFEGKTVSLGKDLDLSRLSQTEGPYFWTAIGKMWNNPFEGTFDGGGHTVKGLYINSTLKCQGLFGYTSGGEIRNLTVEGSVTSTGQYTAGIVGNSSGTNIFNCTNRADISGGNYAGGIAGSAGTISNCFSSGTVTGTGIFVGSIAGSGTANNSYSIEPASGIFGENGTVAKERELKHGYVVWNLNTSAGTEESTNLWKQGEEYPELGFGPVYRVRLVNYSSGKAKVTFSRNVEVITSSAIFSSNGAESVYVGGGELILTPEALPGGTIEGFAFNSGVIGEGGVYTVLVESDITLECGLPEDLNAGSAEKQRISWYTANPDAPTYTVNTAGELWGLSALVNGNIQGYGSVDFSGKTISLGENINLGDLAGTTGGSYLWTPIGSQSTPFKGSFDGDGHTVSGIYINGESDYHGLFGYTNNGKISNLAVSGSVTGNNNVGVVVGYAENTEISKCQVNGATTVSGINYVGGIAGKSTGIISQCVFDEDASASGSDYVGGIAGQNTNSIADSYSLGSVTATSGTAIAGGVAGAVKKISGSFYYRSGSLLNIVGAGETVTACYYLGESREGAPGEAKTKEEFAGRELAWLLDTAYNSHSRHWQTGAGHPVLGEGTVYLFSLSPKAVQSGKSVSIAQPGEGDLYTLYGSQQDGGQYTYLLKGETAALNVVTDDEKYGPYFYPPNDAISNEEGYKLTMPQQDMNITYLFAQAVDGDIAWYTAPGQDEYLIHTEAEFRGLALLVNGLAKDAEGNPIPAVDFDGSIILLADDITVSGSDWVPVGGSGTPFNGTFDGAGHKVSGYFISTDADYQGLFGYVEGTVKNLTVDGKIQGGKYAGGVAGYMGDYGSVSNCTNLGSVTAKSNVGGITGSCGKYTAISGCKNEGDITATATGSNVFAGGITGIINSYSTLENCSNTGAVTCAGKYAGGVVGNPYSNATIKGCWNSGKVTGGSDYVGGVAGGIDSGLIELSDSWNSGDVTGTGTGNNDFKIGGVAGDVGSALNDESFIRNCYNTGKVTNNSGSTSKDVATGGLFGGLGSGYGENIGRLWNSGDVVSTASNTGGIAGVLKSGNTLKDCYNLGSVTGKRYAGGIAGYNDSASGSKVASSFNYGELVSGSSDVGAIAGSNYGNNAGCYYLNTMEIKKDGADAAPDDAETAEAKSREDFKSYDLAYLLNTAGDTIENRGVWTQGDPYPVFGDGIEKLLYKAELLIEGDANGTVKFEGIEDTGKPYAYFEEGQAVTLIIKPDNGYIMKYYTVSGLTGKYLDSTFTEDPDGLCTVNLTMPAGGIIVKTAFVEPVEGTFSVTFDANGGGWSDNETEKIKIFEYPANTRLTPPEPDPTWSARLFTGWYTDKECTVPYIFSTAVQADITLYAGWETYYKATFDANGGDWGDEPSFAAVKEGQAAERPGAVPVREGYTFVDWYTDKDDCVNAYDFSEVLTGDIILYAGWTKKGTCQVIFFPNGGVMSKDGAEKDYYKVSIPKGSLMQTPDEAGYIVIKPAVEEEEFTLRGWYNNPYTGSKWNFENPVTANMTLYAHWDGNTPTIIGGTREDPMEIEDMELLIAFRDSVNSGNSYAECYFKLVADLTLPDGWVPIGNSASKFMAYIDGDDHTITVPEGERPLFGDVDSAEISNLNIYGEKIDGSGLMESYKNRILIDNCTIKSGSSLKGSGFVGHGSSAGADQVEIQNCVVEPGVTVGYTRDQEDIGGMVGSVYVKVRNCESYADVYGTEYVGGIVGRAPGSMGGIEVYDSYSGGTVNGTGDYVGGIVGAGYTVAPQLPGVIIYDSCSTASVRGNKFVGGILGADTLNSIATNAPPPTIVNNYWLGDSISGNDEYVGGIVGYYKTVRDTWILKNNYYADPDAPDGDAVQEGGLKGIGKIDNIFDGFDPEEAFKLKPRSAFASGEVAYLLDGGEEEHRNTWTMEDGRPALGTPSYYPVSVVSSGSGIITVDGAELVYKGWGKKVKVTAVPEEYTENEEYGPQYAYVPSIAVTDIEGQPVAFSQEELSFTMPAGGAAVNGEFLLQQVGFIEPPPDNPPPDNPPPDDDNDEDDDPPRRDEDDNPLPDNEDEPAGPDEDSGNYEGDGVGPGEGGAGGINEGDGTGVGDTGDGNIQSASSGENDSAKVPAGTVNEQVPESEKVLAPVTDENPDDKETSESQSKSEEDEPDEEEPEDQTVSSKSVNAEKPKEWILIASVIAGIVILFGIIRFILYRKKIFK